jgi:integrase
MLAVIAKENGPTLADRMLAHTRRALNWYEANGKDDDFRSPMVRGMAKTKPKELARKRVVTPEELREIDAALPSVNPVFAGIVRTLMYSAQRRDEIARMQWKEIDGDVLIVPAERYKTKRDNLVPLTPKLKELIEAQPRRAKCAYVFSTNGKTPFSGFSKCKAVLDATINAARKAKGVKEPIPNWRLHDLRGWRDKRHCRARLGARDGDDPRDIRSSRIRSRKARRPGAPGRGYRPHLEPADRHCRRDRQGQDRAKLMPKSTR